MFFAKTYETYLLGKILFIIFFYLLNLVLVQTAPLTLFLKCALKNAKIKCEYGCVRFQLVMFVTL